MQLGSRARFWLLSLAFVVVGCSHGSTGKKATVTPTGTASEFRVGGVLEGLAPGDSVTLQNNGGDDLLLTQPGPFSFLTKLESGANYNVTVLVQPAQGNCSVMTASGVVPLGNVQDVEVSWDPPASTLVATDLESPALLRELGSHTGGGPALSSGALDPEQVDACAFDDVGNLYFISNQLGQGGPRLFRLAGGSTTPELIGVIPAGRNFTGLCFSNTAGEFYAFSSRSDEIVRFSVDASNNISYPVFVAFATIVSGQALALEPSTDRLVLFDAGGDQLLRFDRATGAAIDVINLPAGHLFTGATYGDAGKLLAFSKNDGQLYEVLPQTASVVPIAATGVGAIGGLATDAATSTVSGISSGVTAVRFDLDQTPQPGLLLAKTRGTTGVTGIFGLTNYAPGVVLAAGDDWLAQMDPLTGSLQRVGSFSAATGVRALAWSDADSTLIAVEVVAGGADVLHVVNALTAETTPALTLSDSTLDVQAASFHPDGTLYLAAESAVGDRLLSVSFSGGTPVGSEVDLGAIGHDQVRGLSWNPTLHVLYGVSQASDQMLRINPFTAAGVATGPLTADVEALATSL